MSNPSMKTTQIFLACSLALSGAAASAQQAQIEEKKKSSSADDLVKATANPIAAMISLPLQSNWEKGVGPDNEVRYTMNVQPVIPFKINEDWNLVTRTIVPIVRMPKNTVDTDASWNLSDTVMTLMFSPAAVSKVIWGAGPVFLLPTATDKKIGLEKWGLGPSGVILVQQGAWTLGGLANHIWSVAGNSDRTNVSMTYLNPFATYALGGGWSATMQAEFTQNWKAEDGQKATVVWTPVVSKLMTFGKQPVSIGLGYRHYSKAPTGSPDNGVRLVFNFLFPK